MQSSQHLPVVEHKNEAEGENSQHVNAQREQEEEEVAIVSSSNAVVDPRTVMVKVLRMRRRIVFIYFERNANTQSTIYGFLMVKWFHACCVKKTEIQ